MKLIKFFPIKQKDNSFLSSGFPNAGKIRFPIFTVLWGEIELRP
jgi:hypothetical protein